MFLSPVEYQGILVRLAFVPEYPVDTLLFYPSNHLLLQHIPGHASTSDKGLSPVDWEGHTLAIRILQTILSCLPGQIAADPAENGSQYCPTIYPSKFSQLSVSNRGFRSYLLMPRSSGLSLAVIFINGLHHWFRLTKPREPSPTLRWSSSKPNQDCLVPTFSRQVITPACPGDSSPICYLTSD
jgi:hypothetical protein